MQRLFEVPVGTVAELTVDCVGMHDDAMPGDREVVVMVNRVHRCRAVATADYKMMAGTLRRRFVHLTPPVDGNTEMWMADSQVECEHPFLRG